MTQGILRPGMLIFCQKELEKRHFVFAKTEVAITEKNVLLSLIRKPKRRS